MRRTPTDTPDHPTPREFVDSDLRGARFIDSLLTGVVMRGVDVAGVEIDAPVAGEWSLAQTLRHLVMATDTWLGRAVLGRDQPDHPAGLPNREYASDGYDTSVFSPIQPTWQEVLEARADRVAMVRDSSPR